MHRQKSRRTQHRAETTKDGRTAGRPGPVGPLNPPWSIMYLLFPVHAGVASKSSVRLVGEILGSDTSEGYPKQ